MLPVHIDAVRENIRYPEEGTLLRRYFDENLCDADRKFLPQWLGLHLIQHCLAKRAGEHFLLLQGDGGNGKSVIIDMIAGLVGYDAVATESLDGLNERTTHQLIGKVAMLAPENKGDWDLKLLNRLVSQEIIPSRPLYRDPAPFRPRLLVTQACNRPPVFNEKSRALERRMLVMQLTKVFDTSKGVIEDLGRVIAESEYAVLAGCALWGAKQIFENGGRLDIPEQLKAQGKKLARNGVQLEEFVEHLEFGEFAISKKELLTFYLQWMSEENRSKQGMNMSSLIDGLQVIAARDHGPILVQNGISIGIQRTGRREGYTEVAAGPEMEVAGRNVGYSPIKDERGTEIKLAKREELIYGVRIKEGVIDSEPVGIDWKGGPDRTCASKDDQGELPGIQSAADTEIAELKARIAELEARKAS